MLNKLFEKAMGRKPIAVANPESLTNAVSVWKDTGKIYYLENTLKLTYQANSGLITLEKLSLASLPALLNQIDQLTPDSPLARSTTANQQDAFNISLCGITWQQNKNTRRIKAIPAAAVLRSKTSCFSRSQAVFRHAFLLEHDDLMSPSRIGTKAGIFTYHRVSVEQFTRQIRSANEKITGALRKSIYVRPDNFDTSFTEHETQQLEKLVAIENSNDAKLNGL